MLKTFSSGCVLVAVSGAALGQSGTLVAYADQDSFGTGPTLGSGFTATVQPAGIRAPTNGARFFNIEGNANGAFASWGGVEFDLTEAYAELDNLAILAGFSAGDWTITGVELQLTQSNASFTANGGVEILYTAEDGLTDFDCRSGALNRYTFPTIPFATTSVLSYTFIQQFNGFIEEYSIGIPVVLADVDDQNDTFLSLILNPADDTVAATYKGQDSPFNSENGPALELAYDLGPRAGCYADCDTSTGVGVLDIFDFLCYQNEFAAMAPYACECDTSTGVGVCDIFDFLCFQNAFANGCP